MNRKLSKCLPAALIAGLCLPLSAIAADEALLKRIDELSQQLEQLKQQVRAQEAQQSAAPAQSAKEVENLDNRVTQLEGKSLGKWLTIGGDYRFRVDSLHGETRTFTDVNGTFGNVQQALQADFFANPSTAPGSSTYFGAPAYGSMSTAGALSALMNFSHAMAAVRTVSQANAFVGNPANGGLIQGIGQFAAQVPAYKPDNTTLYTNRFAIDLHATALRGVTVTARLVMYKIFGADDMQAISNGGNAPYFADRVGVFDGTLGHVPSSNFVNVDRAYATWSNIGGRDLWFSVGRRPSTNGAPSNLRLNTARPGNGGTPALLVDYAFDGMTIGYAPDIDALPGTYGKFCYGRGFESGYREVPGNSLQDTDMFGVAVIPVDTDRLRAWLQWNRGFNIFDAPKMSNTYFGNTAPKTDLGDIEWWGGGAMSTLKAVGPGDLNLFVDVALSKTHPNGNVSAQFGFQSLLGGGFFAPEAPTSKTGSAVALGVRYDLPSKTKGGIEYNHGSKNWITFAPAADDMWTAKAGTRGNVYEVYLIQELANKPVSSYFSKAFFRLGYQYYDFQYTGSNNWVGAPVRMSEVNGQMMTLTPLKNGSDIYATFEVKF